MDIIKSIKKRIFKNKNIVQIQGTNNNENRVQIQGVNNKVIDKDGKPLQLEHLHIEIIGNNNIIRIHDVKNFLATLHIIIGGSNCEVEIGANNFIFGDIAINMGSKNENSHVINSKVIIGDNNRFSGWGNGEITNVNSNSIIQIGNDCMFANGVMLYNTDGHPIYEYNQETQIKGRCLNTVNPMKLTIGNHVWIGKDALILKNVNIPNDCIIGRSSVVATKNFTKEHCVIAGNPAKVVKENVTWDVYSREYIENEG